MFIAEKSIGSQEEWPEFLTVLEAAAIMRVSRMTVYRLVQSEELHSIRIGRGFRIPADSLAAFLEGKGL